MGFDLDGTLYDEFDFVRQVYPACLAHCADLLNPDRLQPAGCYISKRWLEKGSSYPHLFEEVFELYGLPTAEKEIFISRALSFFRTFKPRLSLPARSDFMLEIVRKQWPVFLVTDGRVQLQKNKFDVLGLSTFFSEKCCCFTGSLPAGSSKPSPSAYEALALPYSGPEVIFFGDRDVDKEFAQNLNFQFVKVKVMHPVLD